MVTCHKNMVGSNKGMILIKTCAPEISAVLWQSNVM